MYSIEKKMFNAKEIKNVLLNNTPLYDDVINIIINMAKPHKFEVGKKYYQNDLLETTNFYEVVKKTKCFITIRKNDENETNRYKIRTFEDESEYIRIKLGYYVDCYETLQSYYEFNENIHTIALIDYEPKVISKCDIE